MNTQGNFTVPFNPNPITVNDLGKGRVFTLRGPRQVGKTRFLKRLHQENPNLNPVYESLDIVRTEKELVAFIKRVVAERSPRLILLDEISSVPRWQKAIKYLFDKEELDGIDFVLSGSSATDIKRGAERLPGRRGPEIEGGWDRTLLPLSFAQFIKHTALVSEEELALIAANKDAPQNISQELHQRLGIALLKFLKVGGFPSAILAEQEGSEKPFRTMMAIIRSDFEKRKKSRIILDQVLARVNQVSVSAVTWETFAKPINATKVIVRQYVDELCENYLLMDVECIDLARNQRSPKKPRKLYWIDPLIPSSIAFDGLGADTSEAAIVESLVGFELIRRNERNLWEGLNQLRRVYLWRDSRGGEVDFVLWNKERTAIEVKWQNQVSEWDARPINKTFGGGLLLTKNVFATFENTKVMPVYWFLATDRG